MSRIAPIAALLSALAPLAAPATGAAQGAAGAAASAPAPERAAYVADGRRVGVTVRYDRVMLGFHPRVSAAKREALARAHGLELQEPSSCRRLLVGHFRRPVSKARVWRVVRRLGRLPGILHAGLVVEPDGGGEQGLTAEVRVQLDEDVSRRAIRALNRRLGARIVRSSRYHANRFTVRTKSPAVTSPLELALAYHDDPRVVFAYPNFVLPVCER